MTAKIFSITELARVAGISRSCLSLRLRNGWTLFDAMTIPPVEKYKIGSPIGITRVVVGLCRPNGRIITKCTVCGTEHYSTATNCYRSKFKTCQCARIKKAGNTRKRRDIEDDERFNPMNKFLSSPWK